MTGMMKAAVMTGIARVEIQELPIPQAGPGEVLVRIEYVGICGSDLHYYESGRIGDFIVQFPFILGHEAALCFKLPENMSTLEGALIEPLAVGAKHPGIIFQH